MLGGNEELRELHFTIVLLYLSSFIVTLGSGHHSTNWLLLTAEGSLVEQMLNPDMNSCPWPSLDSALHESCCMML